MNKNFKILGLLILLCCSFYYTNQMALLMRSKDPIYESIMISKEDYEIDSVNAVIKDDTIIPGLIGTKVNVEKSFRSMKNDGYFSTNHFVFDEVLPQISIKTNPDKIITQGNPIKKGVSLIIENKKHLEYLEEMGIPYAFLIDNTTKEKHMMYGTKINIDEKNYNEIEKYLSRQKENQPFCFLTKNSKEFCQKQKKVLIQETMTIQNNTFIKNYNKITSGAILYIDSGLSIDNLKILLNQIYFRGLNILSLEELTSEAQDKNMKKF